MQTDPTIDPQGGGAPGAGAGGSPDPEHAETATLKAENAELRKANRREHAEALAAKHGLTPTMTELVSGVDRDKQDELAAKLAEELKGTQAPAAPTAPAPAEPAQAAPAVVAPVVPDPGTDPALQHMATGGEGAPSVAPVPQGWRAQMEAEINGSKSLEETKAIQAKYQDIARKERLGQ